MAYETQIAFRYLYGGSGNKRSIWWLVLFIAVAVISALIFAQSDFQNGFALIGFALGCIGAVTCSLLFFVSVFTAVSVLGVVLGVAALTIVLAVTTGFQKQFREKVLGVNAHVIITKPAGIQFYEYRDVMKKIAGIDPEIIAIQPFDNAAMLVTKGTGEASGVALKGVLPDKLNDVLDLHKYMVAGSVDSLDYAEDDKTVPPVIVGKVLAEKMSLEVGDPLTVVAPLSNVDPDSWTTTGTAPLSKQFKVTGIFYSGFDEYDRRLMYVNLREAQALRGAGDQVLGVELKVKNVDRAEEIARKIEATLDSGAYQVQDWSELNQNLFTALAAQKIVLLIILTLIVAVAAFNMVSALTMMVTDKTREVAILKSMGAPSMGIARLFLVVGVAISAIGTVFGLGLGLALCEAVNLFSYSLDPEVYMIDKLPIVVNAAEVAYVALVTLIIGFLATIFPSLKASGLPPVEGLRQ